MGKPKRPGWLRALTLAASLMLGSAWTLGSAPTTAAADTWSGFELIWVQGNVYATSSESVTVSYTDPSAPVSMTVTAPDGTVQYACTSDTTDTLPNCTIGFNRDFTSTTTGVWLVAINTTESTGLDTWNIAAKSAAGTQISGRVWADSWGLYRYTANPPVLTTYYVSSWGSQYRSVQPNFRGVNFALRANSLGMLDPATCNPIYSSRNIYPAVTVNCPDSGQENYRLFLSQPAADLPESADNWADGRTSRKWVLPQYTAPTVTNLAFDRTAATAYPGTITGDLTGQSGLLDAYIDTDNDGVFTGAADVKLSKSFPTGSFSFDWDGLDGNGLPVAATADINIRVAKATEGEIHFLAGDVEGRGPITITQIAWS